MHDFYTITELTKEFGISTRTIRFYEDEGLIHPLRRGRTRLFRQSDRQILRNILRGKRLGFSIAEIREIIGMYKTPPGEAGQLKTIIGKVKRRREELEQKRHDIDDLLAELDQAEEACLTRLAELGIDQSRRA
ncbi:MAG: MerR family DNA-binding transcriptional regulator [Fulvimarina manganoxydans]|uniref:MerR family transcriptional regulator n=1 Tax=Fulvimarina manganoxydans TaxID=937218 RepID=UPI002356980F|nr:MerR family DNA-binding transcriptional regulator [Fulvimarina manganoxydans]MCK5931844.1 MerR family DNA-binding transcriptional regulator [Fulvimarina manganoxydans]